MKLGKSKIVVMKIQPSWLVEIIIEVNKNILDPVKDLLVGDHKKELGWFLRLV